jgi:hypothetical protein
MQELMNEDESDNDSFKPRPISNGNFRLSHRCDIKGIDGPLDHTRLGLTTDNPGEVYLPNKQGRGFKREWHCSNVRRCFFLLGGMNPKHLLFT